MTVTVRPTLPPLPRSWGELTWQQLTDCWHVKMRYAGNADVARVAAMMALLGCEVCRRGTATCRTVAGETLYRLRDRDGCQWTVTAREASQMARQALPWFDYPYGDPGEPAVRDRGGKVVRERREPVAGYVGPMRDALSLPVETLKVGRRTFALPQVACNNITWQQYRSLQGIVQQAFSEGLSEEDVAGLQAQFLAHILVPRTVALFDTTGGSIRLRLHREFLYNAGQAESLVGWWRRHPDQALYHICLQVYQTALHYYSLSYPMLFGDEGRRDMVRDALTGETGTINAIMTEAGYCSQQEVYDSNLPFVLDILNTMTRKAREIERMNSRIRKK